MSNQFFHDLETPDLNNSFFKSDKKLVKRIPKTLIISGGSRNGNHIVWSLLDGNSQLPYLPGEDKFLSQTFWRAFRSIKKFKKDFFKNNFNVFRKLNGITYDKWEQIYQKKIDIKKWAGSYKAKSAPLQEFPAQIDLDLNYLKYRNFIKKNIKPIFSFFYFYSFYLKAFALLSPKKNKKKLQYEYIYAESGLRREIYFLLKNNVDIKCIVPIRKFESFYFSITKSIFNSSMIKDKFIKEAWERWYHKTNDYLFLKKKFPEKIVIVKFEDLEDISKREKTMKKICKKINIKFEKINVFPTHFENNVQPNSSFTELFRGKDQSRFRIINMKAVYKLLFPKKRLPKKYAKIYKLVEKNSY